MATKGERFRAAQERAHRRAIPSGSVTSRPTNVPKRAADARTGRRTPRRTTTGPGRTEEQLRVRGQRHDAAVAQVDAQEHDADQARQLAAPGRGEPERFAERPGRARPAGGDRRAVTAAGIVPRFEGMKRKTQDQLSARDPSLRSKWSIDDDQQTRIEAELIASGRGDVVPREGVIGAARRVASRRSRMKRASSCRRWTSRSAAAPRWRRPNGPSSESESGTVCNARSASSLRARAAPCASRGRRGLTGRRSMRRHGRPTNGSSSPRVKLD